jgi:hypothetical protein
VIEDWQFRAFAIVLSVLIGSAVTFIVTPHNPPPRVACTPPAVCSTDHGPGYDRRFTSSEP